MNGQPWARINDPEPIPEPLNTTVLLSMDDDRFDLLMRSHLSPREETSAYRRNWKKLWALLAFDPILSANTTEFLIDLLAYTQHHLDQDVLDAAAAKRARKFAANLRMGIQRLRSELEGPYGWSADLAASHPEQSRAVIGRYLTAIARHRVDTLRARRTPTAADLDLWNLLTEAGVHTPRPAPPERPHR